MHMPPIPPWLTSMKLGVCTGLAGGAEGGAVFRGKAVTRHLGTLNTMDAGNVPYRVSMADLNALTDLLAAELQGGGILGNAGRPAAWAQGWPTGRALVRRTTAPTHRCGSPPSRTTGRPVACSTNTRRHLGRPTVRLPGPMNSVQRVVRLAGLNPGHECRPLLAVEDQRRAAGGR